MNLCFHSSPVFCQNTMTGAVHPTQVHRGTYTFDQLIAEGMFVDKSMMIKKFIESKCRTTIITRPRKWGNTVNLDMVQRFFEVEINKIGVQTRIMDRKYHKLFEGGEIEVPKQTTEILTLLKELKPLKIANDTKTMKRLGMIPVLRFNMSKIIGKHYPDVENKLKAEMKALYTHHNYLKLYCTNESQMLNTSDKARLMRYYSTKTLELSDLVNGLYFLSRLLFEHYTRKIIVLLEDFDTPVNHADEYFVTQEDKYKLQTLLIDMFRELPENWYMKRTLMTGTLPSTATTLFPNSCVCIRSILDEEYSEYFGFTDAEVDGVLKMKNIPTDKNSTGKMRYWYKGFAYGNRRLYNPLDIMGFVSNKGWILDYWLDSGRIKLLDNFLVGDRAQDDLSKLLEDRGIMKSFDGFGSGNENDDRTFYKLLLHNGYLNAYKTNQTAKGYLLLKIPNQPVRNYLVDLKTQWVCEKYDIWMNDLYDFVGGLITCQVKQLKENLDCVFDSLKNSTLQSEGDYQTIMGNVLSRLLNHNFIFSNKHFNMAGVFHMIVPRSEYQGHVAFVLEYAVLGEPDSRTEMARQLAGLAHYTLERIDNNVYGPEVVKYKHVDRVITVAIAFYKTKLEIAYKIFKQE